MLDQTTYAQWIGTIIGEYRLTRMLGMTPMGPMFAADSTTSASTFLLRVLTVLPAQSSEAMESYRTALERQAGHISTLRHPYILPLVNYGISQGLPYFVWPYSTMRSLTTRLTQSGVLDVVTAGRYLDQIAAALEYAHEHSTFHRNLSLDCIYLQMDGQIAVADFGVRRLFEMLSPAGSAGYFYGSLEACAPEQLTGGQVGSYTDVYALGAVIYRLLTGHSVFSGENFQALAEQHLRAPLPSLSRARPGMPPALDNVLAGALAKDPAVRTLHPGTFADAYQQVVDPINTRRVPFDSPSAYGGPSQLPRSAPSQPSPGRGISASSSPYPGARVSQPSGPAPASLYDMPTSGIAPGASSFLARGWWFFVLLLVLVPLLSIGAFYLANHHPGVATAPGGTLQFVDSSTAPSGNNDAFRISVNGLPAPAQGSEYQVWFVNQGTEQISLLGVLAADGNLAYHLAYAPSGITGRAPINLLAVGDLIEITEEHGNVAAPAGHVLLQVRFPPQAFVHIKHLLLSYPTTPGKIGLLVGVLQQTQALNTQVNALNQAVGSGQQEIVRCLAQSIVDISEGSHGAHYQPLSGACAAAGVSDEGDGFGLLAPANATGEERPGYIKNAADHASLATATPDATESLRQYASKVETTLSGVTKAVTTVDNAALALLKSPTDVAAASTLATASTEAYQGTGSPGSGGAVAAYKQGQQMATLSLTAPTA